MMFGFLDSLIYQRMLQTHNASDKTKAFEDAFSVL